MRKFVFFILIHIFFLGFPCTAQNNEIQNIDKNSTPILDSLIVKCRCLELMNEMAVLNSNIKIANQECKMFILTLATAVDVYGKKTKSIKKNIKKLTSSSIESFDRLEKKFYTLKNTIYEFGEHPLISSSDSEKLYSQLVTIMIELDAFKRSITQLEDF